MHITATRVIYIYIYIYKYTGIKESRVGRGWGEVEVNYLQGQTIGSVNSAPEAHWKVIYAWWRLQYPEGRHYRHCVSARDKPKRKEWDKGKLLEIWIENCTVLIKMCCQAPKRLLRIWICSAPNRAVRKKEARLTGVVDMANVSSSSEAS